MQLTKLSLLISLALIAPSFAYGAPLPAGGDEPGKAYLTCLEGLAKKDKAAVIASCFAKDDPWLTKTNLDYFTGETFSLEVRQLQPAFRLIDVKISGGQTTGEEAELSVDGTMILQRLESTGDIVEVDRYPVKGSVTLRRTAGLWRHTGEKLERVYP